MIEELKLTAWRILAGGYYYSGMPRIRHRGRVAILTYHRVVPESLVREEHIQPGMYVLDRAFEDHMAYLKKQFTILPIERLVEMRQTGRLEQGRSYCAVTFDDGWRDNYQYAFPLLKKYGVPATVFLATDYIGTANWFWPDRLAWLIGQARGNRTEDAAQEAINTVIREIPEIGVETTNRWLARCNAKSRLDADTLIEWCKDLDPQLIARFVERLGRALRIDPPQKRLLLNWDEVREMASHGITFGSHSCTHRIMTKVSLLEAERELTGSWQAMLQQGIKPAPVFCFPNGNCNQELKNSARKSGYLAAVGCTTGLVGDGSDDLFDLKRIGFHQDISSSVTHFVLALSGLR